MEDFEKYFNEFNEQGSDPEHPESEASDLQAAPDGSQATAPGPDPGDQAGAAQAGQSVQPDSGADPGQDDDPEGGPEADQDSDDVDEETRKKAHGYDSMKGRLAKEQEELRRKAEQYEQVLADLRRTQEERRRLDQELAAKGQGQTQAQKPDGPAPGTQGHGPDRDQGRGQNQAQAQNQAQNQAQAQPLPMAEIPEEIKEEAEAFARDYPDLAPLLRFPGREGEKLRKLLGEYGPDVAAIHGQGVMAQYRLSVTEQQMAQRLAQAEQTARQAREDALRQFEEERRSRHYADIGSRHEEVRWMFDPARREDYAAFRKGLDEWVMDRPMREAVLVQQVLQQGTAADVIAILDQFKASQNGQNGRNGRAEPARNPGEDPERRRQMEEERERMAQAAAAVPGRTAPPRAGGYHPPDDFGAAWNEANRH